MRQSPQLAVIDAIYGGTIVIGTVKAKARKQLSVLAAPKTKIEGMIEQELRKRMPCSLTLQHLKKLRLRIKDHTMALRFWLDDRNFGMHNRNSAETSH